MPTDPSINLATSAAAAFCARLCVHPLEHFKASFQHVHPLPHDLSLRQRLNHFLTAIRLHLRTLNLLPHSCPHYQRIHHHYHSTIPQDTFSLWRGLYHGIPLALIINVPALAFFLSTYDATKHVIDSMSSTLSWHHFQAHHFETHMVSGFLAKASGSLLWAPQAKLATMHRSHHGQLSVQEAFQLIKRVAGSKSGDGRGGSGGIWSLWSGYRTTLLGQLPYTMLYFATYEKLKQFARNTIISREEHHQHQQQRGIDYRLDQRPLDLGTYMICVSGAVAISATLCHTAVVLRDYINDRWITSSSIFSRIPIMTSSLEKSPIIISSTASSFKTSGSLITTKLSAPALVISPQHFHYVNLWAASGHTAITQHANMTTTSIPKLSPRRLLPRDREGMPSLLSRRHSPSRGGILRMIGRGLGPRVMWTVPGVTLTTAGFEVFRNLALGVV